MLASLLVVAVSINLFPSRLLFLFVGCVVVVVRRRRCSCSVCSSLNRTQNKYTISSRLNMSKAMEVLELFYSNG